MALLCRGSTVDFEDDMMKSSFVSIALDLRLAIAWPPHRRTQVSHPLSHVANLALPGYLREPTV
eukprot:scaffold10220_cov36-Tisochrysis_lutea.AAC.4